MGIFKRTLAALLCGAVCVSLAACHPKNEVAATAKEKNGKTTVEITSAQYLYALTSATLEAQNNIASANSDEEIKDYSKYKVVETDADGKETKTEYYKWIENHAKELLAQYAGAMIKREDLKLELDETTEQSIESYGNMYWQYYYQPVFEKNGISSETYLKMFTADYFENEYFLSIYDTDGTNAVAESTVSKTFYQNYCLGNAITISVSEATDDSDTSSDSEETSMTLDEAKKLLNSYKKRIEDGTKFDTIFSEYNTKYNSSDSESEETESDPTTVFASSATDEESDIFETVNKMKKNAVKVIVNDDKTEVTLVQKLDIKSDEDTYYKNYRETVLHQLKDDEFTTDFEKYCDSLEISYDKSVTKRLNVKKIDVSTES